MTAVLPVLAVVVLFLAPPLPVWFRLGPGRPFAASLFLSVLSLVVFMFLYAVPGLALWGCAVLHALFVSIRKRPKVGI